METMENNINEDKTAFFIVTNQDYFILRDY